MDRHTAPAAPRYSTGQEHNPHAPSLARLGSYADGLARPSAIRELHVGYARGLHTLPAVARVGRYSDSVRLSPARRATRPLLVLDRSPRPAGA